MLRGCNVSGTSVLSGYSMIPATSGKFWGGIVSGVQAKAGLAWGRGARVSSGVLLAFHKPYGVLSQFTPEPGSRWRTLAEFKLPSKVYALGRLDADSEGLLLLSDEAGLNARLLDPEQGHRREYWTQVEGLPSDAALTQLARGLKIGDYTTRPCAVRRLEPPPAVPPRDPPIRVRKSVPDCWLALELVEGKNRQVRRMTAAVGHPTLRLIRAKIGAFALGELAPGRWRELTTAERAAVFCEQGAGSREPRVERRADGGSISASTAGISADTEISPPA
jgi:23S rRNA pseudouridine2457 synthase